VSWNAGKNDFKLFPWKKYLFEKTAPETATPITIPIFLIVPMIPAEMPSCSFGSEPMIILLLGGWKSPIPRPRNESETATSVKLELSFRYPRESIDKAAIPIPNDLNRFQFPAYIP